MTVLLLTLAGGLGAVVRFLLDGVITTARSWRHPVGTTLINLTGSFALGLLVGLASARLLGGDALLVAGTGFLGGYTTFSTAAVETVRLVQQRCWGAALSHGLGLVVGATVLAMLGYALGGAVG